MCVCIVFGIQRLVQNNLVYILPFTTTTHVTVSLQKFPCRKPWRTVVNKLLWQQAAVTLAHALASWASQFVSKVLTVISARRMMWRCSRLLFYIENTLQI